MGKIRKTVALDKDLFEISKVKLGMPLSTFFNDVLRETFNTSDELEEIRAQIKEHEKALNILRPKECRLEKQRVLGIQQKKDINRCMDTLNRIHESHNKIGENQILFVSNNHGVNYEELLNLCVNQGMNVIKGFESPKPGKKGNGDLISSIASKK